MQLRFIRHATLQIEYADKMILVDPLLARPGSYPSLTLGATAARNPTVPLPCSTESIVQKLDVILVTHSHFDHFDSIAKTQLPKQVPLICQPYDRERFRKYGFKKIIPIDTSAAVMDNIHVIRIEGKHGSGMIARAMGHSSGFIIRTDGEPSFYIAGDTVWTPEIQDALQHYHPDIIVVNAGAAQFNKGAPITMTADDVEALCRAAPAAKVVAVHMEAINHCRLSRAALASHIAQTKLIHQVSIPSDGEALTL
jgi:L-ascorbate metabolism protein UlaG (beta-lactamase superfamily)